MNKHKIVSIVSLCIFIVLTFFTFYEMNPRIGLISIPILILCIFEFFKYLDEDVEKEVKK